MPRIFISYRRDDSAAVVGHLNEYLTRAFGQRNVFLDVESIALGRPWKDVLREELSQCDVFLAIIGRQWLSIKDANGKRRLDDPEDPVRVEIETALRLPSILVIPVVVDNADFPDINALPPSLRELLSRQTAQLRRVPDFERDVYGLIGQIKQTSSGYTVSRRNLFQIFATIAFIFALLMVFVLISLEIVPRIFEENTPVRTSPTKPSSSVAVIHPETTLAPSSIVLGSNSDLASQTNIDSWHLAGWSGDGLSIGVLDRGFGNIIGFEESNDIEVQFPIRNSKEMMDPDTISHGTSVLEVIHSVAPGASLYGCSYQEFAEYSSCVDWFIVSGVNIINHSAGVPVALTDGTSVWAKEVDRAARSNILWVNAAGNFGQGYYQDYFSDINVNSYHEFRSQGIQETLGINPVGNLNGSVMLTWTDSDSRSAEEIDLDLEIIDTTENLIAASTLNQNGNPDTDPFEQVIFSMDQPFGIRIRDINGWGTGVNFALYVEFAQMPQGTSAGSIISPGDSLNALTIGALQGGGIFMNGAEGVRSNEVATYSSRGPLSNGAMKPDLVAPSVFIERDGSYFIGSSVSSALTSGVAALIWEAYPNYSRVEVIEFLRSTATVDDPDFPGPDSNYGYGRLILPLPTD